MEPKWTSIAQLAAANKFAIELQNSILPLPNQRVGALTEKWKLECQDIFGAQIILAEDNITNQILMKKYLELCGLDCLIANNGRELITLLSYQSHIDLVLMDIHMPELNGIESTIAIRKLAQFKNLPIVALSAENVQQEKLDSLTAGMNDFICKPIQIAELVNILKQWVKPRFL